MNRWLTVPVGESDVSAISKGTVVASVGVVVASVRAVVALVVASVGVVVAVVGTVVATVGVVVAVVGSVVAVVTIVAVVGTIVAVVGSVVAVVGVGGAASERAYFLYKQRYWGKLVTSLPVGLQFISCMCMRSIFCKADLQMKYNHVYSNLST